MALIYIIWLQFVNLHNDFLFFYNDLSIPYLTPHPYQKKPTSTTVIHESFINRNLPWFMAAVSNFLWQLKSHETSLCVKRGHRSVGCPHTPQRVFVMRSGHNSHQISYQLPSNSEALNISATAACFSSLFLCVIW